MRNSDRLDRFLERTRGCATVGCNMRFPKYYTDATTCAKCRGYDPIKAIKDAADKALKLKQGKV